MVLAEPPKPRNSFLDIELEDKASPDLKQDIERDKPRVYLGKCIQEVTYHVVPTITSHQQYAEEQEILQITITQVTTNNSHLRSSSKKYIYNNDRSNNRTILAY